MLKKLTNASVPFTGNEIDLMSGEAVTAFVALVFGFTLWNASDAIGQNLAGKLLSVMGQFLPGGNPAQSGDTNDDGPAFGGS